MEQTAVYEQVTGLFTIMTPVPFRAVGYSGRGRGRNNPDLQAVVATGPIPRGEYRVGLPYTHPTKGPVVFRLTPSEQNDMFGRSGFLIHGDNARGDASHGCIILPRNVRDLIAKNHVRRLFVIKLARSFDEYVADYRDGSPCNVAKPRAA